MWPKNTHKSFWFHPVTILIYNTQEENEHWGFFFPWALAAAKPESHPTVINT